jgi:hypothetical protein
VLYSVAAWLWAEAVLLLQVDDTNNIADTKAIAKQKAAKKKGFCSCFG